MIPKAANQSTSKKDMQVATKLCSLLAPIDIDVDMVAFFVSTFPANSQLRLIDMLMAYVNIAKQSDNHAIRAWANSYTEQCMYIHLVELTESTRPVSYESIDTGYIGDQAMRSNASTRQGAHHVGHDRQAP